MNKSEQIKKRHKIIRTLCELNIPAHWAAQQLGISLPTYRNDISFMQTKILRSKKEEIFLNVLKKFCAIFKESEQKKLRGILAQWLGIEKIEESFKILDSIAFILNRPQVTKTEQGYLELLEAVEKKLSNFYCAADVWQQYIEQIFCEKSFAHEHAPKNIEELCNGFYVLWANMQRERIGADWRKNQYICEMIEQALRSLGNRHEQIVRTLFGIGVEKLTQSQAARKFAVSSTAIASIENRALAHLQKFCCKFKELYFLQTIEEEQKTIAMLQAENQQLKELILSFENQTKRQEAVAYYYCASIEELQLSIRSEKCLKSAKIETIGKLAENSTESLAQIRNLGSKSLYEIKNRMSGIGLPLQ